MLNDGDVFSLIQAVSPLCKLAVKQQWQCHSPGLLSNCISHSAVPFPWPAFHFHLLHSFAAGGAASTDPQPGGGGGGPVQPTLLAFLAGVIGLSSNGCGALPAADESPAS
eukprot:11213281-Lingulodinium_polyedra.AAC.1